MLLALNTGLKEARTKEYTKLLAAGNSPQLTASKGTGISVLRGTDSANNQNEKGIDPPLEPPEGNTAKPSHAKTKVLAWCDACLTSDLQDCKVIHLHCLSHLDCGILLGQQKTNTIYNA